MSNVVKLAQPHKLNMRTNSASENVINLARTFTDANDTILHTLPTMAPTFQDVAQAVPSNDALGIALVSRFNGPGVWAAWFLTLATSWVSVTKNDSTHNLPHIGYLLFTNCAAIDLIRQTRLLVAGGVDAASIKGPLAAAFLVTCCGVFHASLQFMFSYIIAPSGFGRGTPPQRRR
jgi:hypothetical protein